jgi:hypothetical protein
MKIKTSLIFLLFVSSFVFVQCKKKKKPEPVETHAVDPNVDSFENMRVHILAHNCVSCHNTAAATNVQHGLVLEGADVYERLINVVPVNADALAAGLKLVRPNQADSSFFYTKCDWNAYPNYQWGNQMPLGADLLSANEILFIKQWINAGAPKTGVVADPNLLKTH